MSGHGNPFAFTEYNCGLLQNAIQQPSSFLFTDLLVLVGYINNTPYSKMAAVRD